ncbi:MAG: oligosaccharide flippase family protein [Planctomycetota bacterium]
MSEPADGQPAPQTVDYASKPTASGRTYGSTAIRGAKLFTVAAIASRFVSLGSQLLLGVLLLPSDFKLWALVLGCVAIFAVLRESSIHRVLISRADDFDRLARPALYLLVGSNLVAIVLIAALSPIFAWFYDEPKLTWLLLAMCAAMLVGLGNPVYQTRVSLNLNFGYMALVATVATLARGSMMVLVAWIWRSPMCFVVGFGTSLLVEAIMYRYRAGKLPKTDEPVLGPIVEILRDGSWIVLGSVATAIVLQGDYLVIGWMAGGDDDGDLLGFYNFGFQIALAFGTMLLGSLRRLLAPTYRNFIDDPVRLKSAVSRSIKLLTLMAGVTGCLMAVVASSALTFVWGEKWQASIIVVQAISFATVTRSLPVIGNALLEAKGKWALRAALLTADAVGTLLAAYVGCLLGGLFTLAIIVGAYRFIVGIVVTVVCLRAMNVSPGIFYRAAFGPILICGAASVLTLMLDYGVMFEWPSFWRMVLTSLVFLGLTTAGLALFMPARLKELIAVLGRQKKDRTDDDDPQDDRNSALAAD